MGRHRQAGRSWGSVAERLTSARALVGAATLMAALALAGTPKCAGAQAGAEAGQSAAPTQGLGERSPVVAALLQAALPPLPLGYIYAGDIGRAILPTSLMVGGSMLVVLEAVELIDWTNEDKSPALLYVGLGAMTVGYIYGIVDAAHAAGDRNARLRAVAGTLSLGPSRTGAGAQIAVRLGSR